jgi:hypothetical protein
MKKLIAIAALAAMPLFAQTAARKSDGFASDFQTVPVMANVSGATGASFQTYVALLNPTASSFPVTVTLYDNNGTKHEAMITLAAGELKTYANFLDAVFGYSGGGAVTFRTADTAGGTRNNRLIVDAEVRTAGASYGTTIPALEFAGSNSPSFAAGITVDSGNRTNIGCFNQSSAANQVKATVLDASGKQTIGSVTLKLPANGWGQAPVTSIVSGGYVRFDPSDAAVCYAVVVSNATNDGRFIAASEYTP